MCSYSFPAPRYLQLLVRGIEGHRALISRPDFGEETFHEEFLNGRGWVGFVVKFHSITGQDVLVSPTKNGDVPLPC